MSAIAGVQSFQPLPEEAPEILSRMVREHASLAPDGGSVARRPGVAMAFGAFHVTEESRRARQPWVDGDLMIGWDGRLDNRGELERLIAVPEASRLTDVELVAGVYRRLGDDAWARLIGDFAAALWDDAAGRLILARDAMGGRPLFYRTDGSCLLWASTLGALAAAQTAEPEIDDDWLLAYLLRLMSPTETPYRGIRGVPAGHLVVAERAGLRIVPCWTLGRHPEIRYRDDRDYEQHFRELFFEAVRVRLRTGGAPVCAELSGGLDSSSVACVARHLLRTESVEAGDVTTYSIVYDRASTADERRYIRPVEQRLGRRSLYLLEDDHPMLSAGFERPWTEIPYFLQTLRAPHVYAAERLAESRTRVVLTGAGGDQLMWNDIEAPYYLADLLARGRLAAVWRELGSWRSRTARTQYPQPLPQLVLRGLLRPLIASLRGRSRSPDMRSLLPYLTGDLRSLQRRSWKLINPPLPWLRPSRLPPVEELRDVISHITWFYHFDRLGFQMSHPFLHRPLVEFCLGIPNQQFVRVDETRSLQRRALRDLLPPEVAQRYTKVGPDEAILRGLRREWSTVEKLLEDSRVCRRGFADAGRLRRALERASGGYAPCNMDLVRLLEVEIWLRGREEPRGDLRARAA
jgi:asparagine synthase (glutamine-hydrolysing)